MSLTNDEDTGAIQQFDFSVDLLRAILWQYTTATNLQGLLNQKAAWYDTNQTQFWEDWYTNVFDLATANDFGLSVWSIILGLPLFVNTGTPTGPVFGFDAQTGYNFDNGIFGGSTSYDLPTETKRIALQLRYFQLTSSGTVPETNRMLAYVFATSGRRGSSTTTTWPRPTCSTSRSRFDLEYLFNSYDILPGRPAFSPPGSTPRSSTSASRPGTSTSTTESLEANVCRFLAISTSHSPKAAISTPSPTPPNPAAPSATSRASRSGTARRSRPGGSTSRGRRSTKPLTMSPPHPVPPARKRRRVHHLGHERRTAYSYPEYAIVSHGGVTYVSLANSNTDTPPSSKWQVLTSLGNSGVVGDSRNLVIAQASTVTATVTADEVIVETALGGTTTKISSFSVTLNTASTGLNGMDTGSPPSSGYLWFMPSPVPARRRAYWRRRHRGRRRRSTAVRTCRRVTPSPP
ncbi:Prophage tail fiber protein [Fimbriiglobus ruber]|uniref:Prophage tail fiber protein n=1 Tax=Fimbriiglobus ruber TaxID=1908690 RepID=A0A225E3I2_9BACT|nr:Prophage tail fiber protein [Fimbriiglobus ruber]